MIAPIVVISTVVVFGSGVALLFAGPGSRSILLPAAQGELHRLARLHGAARARAPRRAARSAGRPAGAGARPWDDLGAGRGARALSVAGAIVGGLVLALLVEPRFAISAALPPSLRYEVPPSLEPAWSVRSTRRALA